ncbi:Aspyridones efflux protein apdF [Vanrija pseudolonga]|uniref:Aspyridones efflux protein apdF n=1 Tax=Vanrija pseudolonga TaxID=143232 RepID=A0AAF1BHT7_9TREE|nr:Aspyridones efflux protein apdF [Vanrija pseudolonga]
MPTTAVPDVHSSPHAPRPAIPKDTRAGTPSGAPSESTSTDIELAGRGSTEEDKPTSGDDTRAPTPALPVDEPPNGGAEAWRVVACATMIAFWFVGTGYSWGVIQRALVDKGFASASTLAFVGSISIGMMAFLAIANARLVTAIGPRYMAVAGVLFMSVAEVLAGTAVQHNSLPGLFLTAGVMLGIGCSFSFMVISVTPAQYFTTRRGTAVGTVFAGGGIGGAVLSLALEKSIRNLGIEWTFRVVGIALAVCCLPAAWGLKERTTVVRKVLIDWSLFKSWDFVLLFLAGALGTFPLFVPPFFLPLYAQSLGLSTSTGAVTVAVFNFSSAVGRFLTGFVSDRLLGPINTLFAVLFITGFSLLALWPSSVSLAPLMVFVIINGTASGGFFAIMPTVVGSVLGMQRLAVAFGMIVTGWAGGYTMGSPIAGYLLGAYGGAGRGIAAYRPAVFFAGAMAMGGALMVGILRWRKSPQWKIKM